MIYTKNIRGMIPFFLLHVAWFVVVLFSVALISSIYVAFSNLSIFFVAGIIFITSLLFILLYLTIFPSGKFIKKSLDFVKCEIVKDSLNIFTKNDTKSILLEDIVKIKYQSKIIESSPFWGYILGSNFGSFLVFLKTGAIVELTPIIKDREKLINEIIEMCNLVEKHQGLIGESATGYTYWERMAQNEFNNSDKGNVNSTRIFKISSLLDYLIAIVAIIGTVLVVSFMFAYLTGRL